MPPPPMLLPQPSRTAGASLERAMEKALDAAGHAIFGLDRRGLILFSNARARSLLNGDHGLSVRAGGLVGTLPNENRRLQSLVYGAIGEGTEGWMLLTHGTGPGVRHGAGKAGLQLGVMCVPSRVAKVAGELAAIVAIGDPACEPAPRGLQLRQMYGLTPAEARIADLLLRGCDAHSLGQALNIRLETARMHIKRILAKTGTHRQADLMRLMLSIPATRPQAECQEAGNFFQGAAPVADPAFAMRVTAHCAGRAGLAAEQAQA